MPIQPTPPPSRYRLFVGVDIAAATFTAVWREVDAAPSRALTLDQSPQGFATLDARLRATGHAASDTLSVREATGSYWVVGRPRHDAGPARLRRRGDQPGPGA